MKSGMKSASPRCASPASESDDEVDTLAGEATAEPHWLQEAGESLALGANRDEPSPSRTEVDALAAEETLEPHWLQEAGESLEILVASEAARAAASEGEEVATPAGVPAQRCAAASCQAASAHGDEGHGAGRWHVVCLLGIALPVLLWLAFLGNAMLFVRAAAGRAASLTPADQQDRPRQTRNQQNTAPALTWWTSERPVLQAWQLQAEAARAVEMRRQAPHAAAREAEAVVAKGMAAAREAEAAECRTAAAKKVGPMEARAAASREAAAAKAAEARAAAARRAAGAGVVSAARERRAAEAKATEANAFLELMTTGR